MVETAPTPETRREPGSYAEQFHFSLIGVLRNNGVTVEDRAEVQKTLKTREFWFGKKGEENGGYWKKMAYEKGELSDPHQMQRFVCKNLAEDIKKAAPDNEHVSNLRGLLGAGKRALTLNALVSLTTGKERVAQPSAAGVEETTEARAEADVEELQTYGDPDQEITDYARTLSFNNDGHPYNMFQQEESFEIERAINRKGAPQTKPSSPTREPANAYISPREAQRHGWDTWAVELEAKAAERGGKPPTRRLLDEIKEELADSGVDIQDRTRVEEALARPNFWFGEQGFWNKLARVAEKPVRDYTREVREAVYQDLGNPNRKFTGHHDRFELRNLFGVPTDHHFTFSELTDLTSGRPFTPRAPEVAAAPPLAQLAQEATQPEEKSETQEGPVRVKKAPRLSRREKVEAEGEEAAQRRLETQPKKRRRQERATPNQPGGTQASQEEVERHTNGDNESFGTSLGDVLSGALQKLRDTNPEGTK